MKGFGIDIFGDDTSLQDYIDASIFDNTRLITSIPEQYLTQVESIVMTNVRAAITPSALGELDRSAGFLEEAFEERDPFLIGLRSWPPLKNVCRTERARAVVRKMGLEISED